MKRNQNIWITILPYSIIAAIILILNIILIWGFDGLTIDDQGYYYFFYNKSLGDLTFRRNILHSLYTLGIMKIASYTSVFFARFLILFLLSIPCAFLIYYFSHYHFKAEKYTSIAISVLPFILPNEILVPTYLAGSYMLLAILFTLISILFILRYLKKQEFSAVSFLLAALFYYMATESSELVAVMLPVFLFLIFIFRKLTLRNILLGLMFTAIAVRKAILIINKPHGKINSISNELTTSEIYHRILHFLDFINPFHGLFNIEFLNIILIGIITAGVILVALNNKRLPRILLPVSQESGQKSKYFYISYYYLFPWAWLILSASPFIFYSEYFTSRYFIMSAIAISFMFFISLNILSGFINKSRIYFIFILLAIILAAGINRKQSFYKYYNPLAFQFNYLEQLLGGYDFPTDAQIIITAPEKYILRIGGKGNLIKSTGTMQYILKRRDIKGQIMIERSFYNPFRLYNRPFRYHNADIDTTKSTFLLRGFNKDKCQDRRLYYALRWVRDSSKYSPWIIYHCQEDGNIERFKSGVGYDSYEATVDSLSALGIKREDIMFGGLPNKKDSIRLGL